MRSALTMPPTAVACQWDCPASSTPTSWPNGLNTERGRSEAMLEHGLSSRTRSGGSHRDSSRPAPSAWPRHGRPAVSEDSAEPAPGRWSGIRSGARRRGPRARRGRAQACDVLNRRPRRVGGPVPGGRGARGRGSRAECPEMCWWTGGQPSGPARSETLEHPATRRWEKTSRARRGYNRPGRDCHANPPVTRPREMRPGRSHADDGG